MIGVNQLCGQIYLGKQGENLARKVYFDEPALWKEEYGDGICELLHQRKGDIAPYPVKLEIEGGKWCWKITSADTAVAGNGKCELQYLVDNVVVKSMIWSTKVHASLGGDTIDPPEPHEAWVDEVLKAAQKVESATACLPIIGENQNWWVWDFDTEDYVDSGVSAEGETGPAGPEGQQGKGIRSMGYYDTDMDGNVGIAVFYTDETIGFIWIPGLKGEKGDDGYTPIKGVDYWTEEDKEEIISEIPKGDKWELIDTIVTTEDVKNVTVRNEPDGNPYNFKKLLVIIKNVTTGASGNAYVQVQGYQSAWTASYYLLTHTNAMVYLAIEGDLAWVETHSGIGDYSQFHNYGKPLPIPKNTFDALQIKGNGTILTGTTFEIWGVRNDENV